LKNSVTNLFHSDFVRRDVLTPPTSVCTTEFGITYIRQQSSFTP